LLCAETTAAWTAEDWQAAFDERAGITEFDHGLPRPVAEAQAMQWCLAASLGETPFRRDGGGAVDQADAAPKQRPTGVDPRQVARGAHAG
jgi:hypothetical protein